MVLINWYPLLRSSILKLWTFTSKWSPKLRYYMEFKSRLQKAYMFVNLMHKSSNNSTWCILEFSSTSYELWLNIKHIHFININGYQTNITINCFRTFYDHEVVHQVDKFEIWVLRDFNENICYLSLRNDD